MAEQSYEQAVQTALRLLGAKKSYYKRLKGLIVAFEEERRANAPPQQELSVIQKRLRNEKLRVLKLDYDQLVQQEEQELLEAEPNKKTLQQLEKLIRLNIGRQHRLFSPKSADPHFGGKFKDCCYLLMSMWYDNFAFLCKTNPHKAIKMIEERQPLVVNTCTSVIAKKLNFKAEHEDDEYEDKALQWIDKRTGKKRSKIVRKRVEQDAEGGIRGSRGVLTAVRRFGLIDEPRHKNPKAEEARVHNGTTMLITVHTVLLLGVNQNEPLTATEQEAVCPTNFEEAIRRKEFTEYLSVIGKKTVQSHLKGLLATAQPNQSALVAVEQLPTDKKPDKVGDEKEKGNIELTKLLHYAAKTKENTKKKGGGGENSQPTTNSEKLILAVDKIAEWLLLNIYNPENMKQHRIRVNATDAMIRLEEGIKTKMIDRLLANYWYIFHALESKGKVSNMTEVHQRIFKAISQKPKYLKNNPNRYIYAPMQYLDLDYNEGSLYSDVMRNESYDTEGNTAKTTAPPPKAYDERQAVWDMLEKEQVSWLYLRKMRKTKGDDLVIHAAMYCYWKKKRGYPIKSYPKYFYRILETHTPSDLPKMEAKRYAEEGFANAGVLYTKKAPKTTNK